MLLRIAVGSTNPVKIEAVQLAFETVWPEQEWEVRGIAVPSGVAAQPMSDEESITGARNRARRALTELEGAYGVGLEGGLQQVGERWFDCGWIVIINKNGHEGIGSSIKLPVPTCMMELIEQGMEMGEAVDTVFQQCNSKQSAGHFGMMTNNAITRKDAYAGGAIAALACFVHIDLFR